MTHVLGVDGGATKTVALVARLDGTVAGVGRSGGSNIYGSRPDEALAAALGHVDEAVAAALAAAGIDRRDLAAGSFGIAGADWPEDFALLQGEMEARGYGRRIVIVNDGVGGLEAGLAGLPRRHGVAVVCGTGVATAARGLDGRVWHTSFWQDSGPGGGHHLALLALRAVYRAELGVEPPTALTAGVLEHFGERTVEGVLHRLTARAGVHPAIDGVARLLLDEAARGDATARRLVLRHGRELGDYALVAARRVGIAGSAFPLVLAGGVLRHPARLLADALVERVRRASPGAWPVWSRFEPAAGVILLALEAAGVGADAAVLANLERTMPTATVFAT